MDLRLFRKYNKQDVILVEWAGKGKGNEVNKYFSFWFWQWGRWSQVSVVILCLSVEGAFGPSGWSYPVGGAVAVRREGTGRHIGGGALRSPVTGTLPASHRCSPDIREMHWMRGVVMDTLGLG